MLELMMSELEQAFWYMHKALPRQAPGSDSSTQMLLDRAALPVSSNRVLDIGCGPGRSSLVLAKNDFKVIAIDTSGILLDELRLSARASGYESAIDAQHVSMFDLPYAEESFDVVWSEGAAYIAGWEAAVRDWQKMLKPGGKMVLTECCWLTDAPSESVRQFWSEGYPTMLTIAQAAEKAEAHGLTVEYTYTFPDSDWWDEYYSPLSERLENHQHSTDATLQRVMAGMRTEIELRKNYAHEYGYVGFILRK
jgi:SAM-dependent methyltransferase